MLLSSKVLSDSAVPQIATWAWAHRARYVLGGSRRDPHTKEEWDAGQSQPPSCKMMYDVYRNAGGRIWRPDQAKELAASLWRPGDLWSGLGWTRNFTAWNKAASWHSMDRVGIAQERGINWTRLFLVTVILKHLKLDSLGDKDLGRSYVKSVTRPLFSHDSNCVEIGLCCVMAIELFNCRIWSLPQANAT